MVFSLKIFRNIYIKDYKIFPYQKLTGRNTLYYSGKIFYNINTLPPDFNDKIDIYLNCDCDFPKWKNLKKIFK